MPSLSAQYSIILRVEIESLGEQLAHLLVRDAQEVPLHDDDERTAEIAAAEAQLEEQRARLRERVRLHVRRASISPLPYPNPHP